MSNSKTQPPSSSESIPSNGSISYKLRQSYLIIDIEPPVDNSQHQDDQSSFSFFTNFMPDRKKLDTSISNILQIIGAIVVFTIVLIIIIKQIRKWCKKCEPDEDKEGQVNKLSLLPSSSSNVVRRKTPVSQ